MVLLCGVFFPVDQVAAAAATVSSVLPLTHAIDLARPLLNDVVPAHFLWHAPYLLATRCRFYVSLVLFRRRLSQ